MWPSDHQTDSRLFTSDLWMMTAGAWQVRVTVEGDLGSGVLVVPVPTLPQTTLEMSGPLRLMLVALMSVLSVGFISIVSAAVREGTLEKGEAPNRRARIRGRIAGGIATALVVVGADSRQLVVERGSFRLRALCIQATRSVDGDIEEKA